MDMSLSPPAATALRLLEQAGFEAWLVGGSVRDACLGRPLGDVDLATKALPAQMERVFAGYTTIPTGLAHGTLTVIVEGLPLEITTYRSDGTYSDGRHPDSVRFVFNIEEDLARRDFTCNAMAWHPTRGLFDPYLGLADCQAGLLRAVGVAQERFVEDALRILRALRFASQLGFVIEEGTLNAMMAAKDGLASVSAERIAQELNRALLGEYAVQALRAYPQVLLLALPELFPRQDDWEHSLRRLAHTPADLALRWAALFVAGDKPAHSAQLIETVMIRLKQPKALREQAVALVKQHQERIDLQNLRLYLSRLGVDATQKLLRLQRAEALAQESEDASQIDELLVEAQRIQAAGEPLWARDLEVRGDDLLALGYPANARLGQALDALLHEVLIGSLPNNKAALMKRAAELLQK